MHVPGDSRLANDKVEKYTDLKIELQRMRNVRVIIVPLVIGCLGSVSKCLVKHLNNLNIYYWTLHGTQVTEECSCHILRCFVTEHS